MGAVHIGCPGAVGDGASGETKTIRAPIAASWRRSAAAGVDPSGVRIAPVVADADETTARWEVHPLAEMAPLIRSCLAATADESRHLIVVCDANGVLLWVEGNAARETAGGRLDELRRGHAVERGRRRHNAIGTALAAEHAVQVFASEHFNEVVQQWTCAAAPVHDPDTGQVIGVIDLTGEMSTVHPHSMAVATATAHRRGGAAALPDARPRRPLAGPLRRSAGRRRGAARAREPERAGGGQPAARLAARGTSRAARRRRQLALGDDHSPRPRRSAARRLTSSAPSPPRCRAGVAGLRSDCICSGARAPRRARRQAAELRLRHSEIVTLLCAQSGWADQRGAERGVYGHAGQAGSIRVEISRLRKLLGDCIESERYRFKCAVNSDVSTVCGLLHRGEVREAAARYEGPAAAEVRRARCRGRARAARALDASVGDERGRSGGVVGLAADPQRRQRSRRLAAAARQPPVRRSPPQPGCLAAGSAACARVRSLPDCNACVTPIRVLSFSVDWAGNHRPTERGTQLKTESARVRRSRAALPRHRAAASARRARFSGSWPC